MAGVGPTDSTAADQQPSSSPSTPDSGTADLEGHIAPVDLSGLHQPGANSGQQQQQQAPEPPPKPSLESRHPQLFGMLKSMALGVDAAATSLATHGREGGATEVFDEKRKQQQSQIQAQQAQQQKQKASQEMDEGNLRMEALRANMAVNQFKLETDRNNAPLEHQKMLNDIEQQKQTFIEKTAQMYGVSPILVKYMEGDSSEQTLGAVSSSAKQNNTDIHNLTYAHTQNDGKPGQGGNITAIDLKANGSRPVPAELSEAAMQPINSILSMGSSLLPADSPNLKTATALADQIKTGLASGNMTLDHVALLQNKIQMLVQAPIAKQTAVDKFNKEHDEAQAANPVTKLQSPEELAKPGAQAAIRSKMEDPNTRPADRNRLQALLPQAAVAQQNAINLKQREAKAQQAVDQGDPATAGKQLADHSLTLEDLKSRKSTPEFVEQATAAAQKIDPNFKAPVAAAQAKIAASQANQSFFGNTDSLLIKGGTLDQVLEAQKNLPAGRLPVFNKYSELASAALGYGSTARYAASVLGVADDYAKVMGGTQGSDTSRQQVLDIFKAVQSREQVGDATDQVRKQVRSQREGRIGTNPYLKEMYPDPQGVDSAQRAAGANGGQQNADPASKFGGVTRK